MIIKSIKYGNFRNYEKEGVVRFATDGKLTIIYGKNGVGKTTLHQLIQWILYEKTSFNKTTTDKLYNLDAGERLRPGCRLPVYGQIEYEHEGQNYIVRREWCYEKSSTGKIIHKTENDVFYVQSFSESGQPVKHDNPKLIIESTIPSGLSPYFFFDGETMIADLKMRGTESAKNLKKALYTIFDLEVLEAAIASMGNINKSHTVLGELENKKLNESEKIQRANIDHQKNIVQIKKLKQEISDNEEKLKKYKEQHESLQRELADISEKIGAQSSKKALEISRKTHLSAINTLEENIKKEQKGFGKETADRYSYMLVSEVAKDAEKRLYLEVQEEKKRILPGLSKELLINLLLSDTCICGNPIHDKECDEFKRLKGYFPPASYKSTYDKFQRYVERHSFSYDEERLLMYLKGVVECKSKIRETQESIDEIDKQIKDTGNVDELIDRRQDLEKRLIPGLERSINECNSTISYDEKQLGLREKKFKEVSTANSETEKYEKQIDFAKEVLNGLKKRVEEETSEYVEKLQCEIQNLLRTMLTSKREVELSNEFQLTVKDNHGDESKSEGQFAVVSFAYIVGILKVLKEQEKLKNKEFPLILDGPFSKLDEDQRRNVIETLPKYVPQVIILTKDDLDDVIDENDIGKSYTILSNEHKNNAEIKEGYLWS